jgi:hypothetical protein
VRKNIMPIITSETPPQGEVVYHEPEYAKATEAAAAGRADKVTSEAIVGGSSLEIIGGAGAVVLAIIALAGYRPILLSAICVIAIGGALMAHGGAVTARWNATVRSLGGAAEYEVGGGAGLEMLGGAAGVALGIIALAHILPFTLTSIAAIALGGAVLFASPAQPKLSSLATDQQRRAARIAHDAVAISSGALALAGAAAVVLGILGLIGVKDAVTLTIVAMLCLGDALVLTGTSLTARFVRRLSTARA